MSKELFRVEHEWEEKALSVAIAEGDCLVVVALETRESALAAAYDWLGSMEIDVESAREMAKALQAAADHIEMLGRLS